MTFDPPSGPPAGWYTDPEHLGRTRWWDGRAWAAPTPTDGWGWTDGAYPPVGDLISRSFAGALAHWRAYSLLSLVTSVAAGVAGAFALDVLLDGVVVSDAGIDGWTNDRIVPAVLLFLAVVALGIIGYFAATAVALDTFDAPPRADRPVTMASEVQLVRQAIATTVRVLPRAIGWFLLLGLALVALALVVLIGFAVATSIGVILILAAVPLMVALFIRWAFINVAVVDGPGNPYSRSSVVVRGRWWKTFGRLLLIGIITGVISFAIDAPFAALGGERLTFDEPTFEVDADGELTIRRIDLSDAAPSPSGVVIGAISATIAATFTTGVSAVAAVLMYRTRQRRPV